MAGGGDPGVPQRGGKKPLDAVINLVPFIDLMAVTIAFLIMTAVWTQLGRVQAGAAGGAGEAATEELPLTLVIAERELRLTFGSSVYEPIPIGDFAKLEARLHEIKAAAPAQRAITVQAEDAVKYEVLVRVIDACIGADLSAVSVTPAS